MNPLNRPSAENILDEPNLLKNLKIYGLLDLVTKTKNKVLNNNHIVNKINNQTVLPGLQYSQDAQVLTKITMFL